MIKPIKPIRHEETKAIEKAKEKPYGWHKPAGGRAVPAFNGKHRGNKKRPITLPERA
jgi:hypothetical protein